MTDEQILAMIEEEKAYYESGKFWRSNGMAPLAKEMDDHACDLTARIDRAHQEQEPPQ